MATAQYQRTSVLGREPDVPSVAEVLVGGEAVNVTYWPSLLTPANPLGAMTAQEVVAYVEAQALYATGNYADARVHLTSRATGADTRTYDAGGIVSGGADTRNWARRWIDEHPDPAAQQTWEVDPLLG